ncbi:MAG: dihydrofolate reductase [Sphingobacteriales bacterium]|nr:MAG: dihydrofolate reductase [Sphingobacteriales bacterium]
MAQLTVFNFLTLNGYFKGPAGDTSWHMHGVEEGRYSEEMLAKDNILLFGRTTYEMMASFWPTEMALQHMPEVAQGMNKAEKIVFSRTMKKASWENTTIATDLIPGVERLKAGSDKDLAVLGSGSIITQLTEAGLADRFEIMIDPVAIGEGTPLLQGLKTKLSLKLESHRVFASGVVLLCYTRI